MSLAPGTTNVHQLALQQCVELGVLLCSHCWNGACVVVLLPPASDSFVVSNLAVVCAMCIRYRGSGRRNRTYRRR